MTWRCTMSTYFKLSIGACKYENFRVFQRWQIFQGKRFIVGNKAKGRISKRVFQEHKACQIFRKTNISNPLIRTRTCEFPKEAITRWHKDSTLIFRIFLLCRMVSFSCTMMKSYIWTSEGMQMQSWRLC